jgi:hypothetical protein
MGKHFLNTQTLLVPIKPILKMQFKERVSLSLPSLSLSPPPLSLLSLSLSLLSSLPLSLFLKKKGCASFLSVWKGSGHFG